MISVLDADEENSNAPSNTATSSRDDVNGDNYEEDESYSYPYDDDDDDDDDDSNKGIFNAFVRYYHENDKEHLKEFFDASDTNNHGETKYMGDKSHYVMSNNEGSSISNYMIGAEDSNNVHNISQSNISVLSSETLDDVNSENGEEDETHEHKNKDPNCGNAGNNNEVTTIIVPSSIDSNEQEHLETFPDCSDTNNNGEIQYPNDKSHYDLSDTKGSKIMNKMISADDSKNFHTPSIRESLGEDEDEVKNKAFKNSKDQSIIENEMLGKEEHHNAHTDDHHTNNTNISLHKKHRKIKIPCILRLLFLPWTCLKRKKNQVEIMKNNSSKNEQTTVCLSIDHEDHNYPTENTSEDENDTVRFGTNGNNVDHGYPAHNTLHDNEDDTVHDTDENGNNDDHGYPENNTFQDDDYSLNDDTDDDKDFYWETENLNIVHSILFTEICLPRAQDVLDGLATLLFLMISDVNPVRCNVNNEDPVVDDQREKNKSTTNKDARRKHIEIFYTYNGFVQIIELMNKWTLNSDVKEKCCMILAAAVSYLTDNQVVNIERQEMKIGAIYCLLRVMHNIPDDLVLQNSAIDELLKLSSLQNDYVSKRTIIKALIVNESGSNSNKENNEDRSGLGILLNAMKTYPNILTLQSSACTILSNLLTCQAELYSEYVELMVEKDAIGVLETVNKHCPGLHEMTQKLIIALSKKSKN